MKYKDLLAESEVFIITARLYNETDEDIYNELINEFEITHEDAIYLMAQ